MSGTAPRGVTPGTDHTGSVVIETKLHPPGLFAEYVPRPRLIQQLDTAITRPVTVVTAPTGYGKSTLLAAWCEQVTPAGRCAWLSLDESDNDPIVFWTYVVHALRRLEPERFAEQLRALQTPGVSLTRAVLPSLLNELWSLETVLVLVLDDYHLVTAADCHDSLEFLLRRIPPTLRLVIGTRVDPPLGLARLRARAEVAHVRMSDLRFTDAEAVTFLTEQLGLALTAVDVQRIVELTEGWPAGLYLGALSLRERTDPGAFIAEFAGSNRLIVDYLASEVLQRLTNRERTFLLRTSILDSFTDALCSAVVSESDTTGLLAEVELHNLFLIPLDAQRQWFRYHHLFKELLQLRLASVEPELVPVLHQRAATWFARAGDVRAAMRHSLLARDFEMAGKLFVEHWAAFVAAGQLATLEGWLTQLPESVFNTSPSLALAAAFVASVVRRPQAEVDRYIHLGEIEGEPHGPLPMGAHSVRSAVALLRTGWPHDDVGLALSAAETAVAEEPDPGRGTYILARCSLGQALFWSGRVEEATVQLTEVLNAPLAPAQPLLRIVARAILAVVWVERGEPARAMELARRAVEEAAEARLPLVPLLWWVPVALSTVLVYLGELEEAEQVLSAELEQRLPIFRPLARIVVLLAIARVRVGLGHTQAGWSLLEEARVVVAGCADPGVLPTWLSETERMVVGQPRPTQVSLELSEGELRVMHLLASDLTRREIGKELYLSMNTVRTHMRSIYTKLDVGTREEAVTRARTLRLIA